MQAAANAGKGDPEAVAAVHGNPPGGSLSLVPAPYYRKASATASRKLAGTFGFLQISANSDLIESQGPAPHCHAGRGRQPESRYPAPDPYWVPDISLTTAAEGSAKFRHDSEHVRAETALALSGVAREADGVDDGGEVAGRGSYHEGVPDGGVVGQSLP